MSDSDTLCGRLVLINDDRIICIQRESSGHCAAVRECVDGHHEHIRHDSGHRKPNVDRIPGAE